MKRTAYRTEKDAHFPARAPVHDTMTFLAGLEKDLTFDACITADDELAVGAVKYALSQGKKIPAEFQVTGYNNSLLSTCSTPEITTVDNRVEFYVHHCRIFADAGAGRQGYPCPDYVFC